MPDGGAHEHPMDTRQYESISLLRERVASLEQKTQDLEHRIDVGDDNVRQGVEVLKEVVVNFRKDLKDVRLQTLGESGKKALNESLETLEKGISQVTTVLEGEKNRLDGHLYHHGEVEGGKRVMERFISQWVQPLVVPVLVAVIASLLVYFLLGDGA